MRDQTKRPCKWGHYISLSSIIIDNILTQRRKAVHDLSLKKKGR